MQSRHDDRDQTSHAARAAGQSGPAGPPATVTAQAGITMDTLTSTLAAAGYGLCAMPAPGDITLGGVLAINAHGSAIPGTGETPLAGQSYGSLSNLRIEAIWFPFTGTPWIKVWSLAPTKPALSIKVTSPYHYGFTNSVTNSENSFFGEVAAGDVSGTPAFEGIAIALVNTGLVFDGVWDIWGQSQDVLLYVEPSTVRIVEAGFAVITARSSIQQVVSDFYTQYTRRLSYYQGLGQYPMNGPIEIRVTGLDQTADSVVSGAQSPILSSVRPRPDHPEWDVAVWLDMGTLPVTPGFSQFYADMESWIWSHYTGSYATVRPEWSKAWTCTSAAPWTSPSILGSTVPAAVSAGQASTDNWSTAVSILTSYDPNSVFSNPFLDTLMG